MTICDEIKTKKCISCGQELPIYDFVVRRNICKPCLWEQQKKKRQKPFWVEMDKMLCSPYDNKSK